LYGHIDVRRLIPIFLLVDLNAASQKSAVDLIYITYPAMHVTESWSGNHIQAQHRLFEASRWQKLEGWSTVSMTTLQG